MGFAATLADEYKLIFLFAISSGSVRRNFFATTSPTKRKPLQQIKSFKVTSFCIALCVG